MKKIILTETQVGKLIDSVINEQPSNKINVKTVFGGTDGKNISHAYLEKMYGLPGGSKYENYVYTANIKDVIELSKNKENDSKFLSVFKPTNDYSNEIKNSYDYIKVNNDVLNQPGSKVFSFFNGTVSASHNGLLALARAMVNMGGVGCYVKISFGNSKEGEESLKQRIVGSTKFDSAKSLNQNLNAISDAFTVFSTNPDLIKKSNSNLKQFSIDKLKNILTNFINNTIIGTSEGFMDPTHKSEALEVLIPKGFITSLDYDLSKFIDQAISLQKTNDFVEGRYNKNKKNLLNQFSGTFLNDLLSKIKQAYINNFKLYVENFLPENKDRILPLIPKTIITAMPIGDYHYHVFHSKDGQQVGLVNPKIERLNKNVETGKLY